MDFPFKQAKAYQESCVCSACVLIFFHCVAKQICVKAKKKGWIVIGSLMRQHKANKKTFVQVISNKGKTLLGIKDPIEYQP